MPGARAKMEVSMILAWMIQVKGGFGSRGSETCIIWIYGCVTI